MKSRFPGLVLAVDDDELSLRAVARALEQLGHDVEVARDAAEAQSKLRRDVALVVLDADMPGVDGFALAQRIRRSPRWADVPILMVTGLSSHRDRLHAVEAGVNDFISKPWEMDELRLRSDALLMIKRYVDDVKREKSHLAAEVRGAQRHTYQAQIDTIRSLVHAAEYKDVDTGAHIDRIRWYADFLARSLSLEAHDVDMIREATPMHDVGKIGIPDSILLKPGPLSPGERRIMETHTTIGARILSESEAEVLQVARTIALSHHERWDGKGYPNGLSGSAIPLAARVCAVADVFDALTMDRCYRPALPSKTVVGMMEAERGAHFDPDVLDVFLDNVPEFERIRREYRPDAAYACAKPA